MTNRRVVSGLLLICALLGTAIIMDDITTGPPKRFLWADREISAPISHAYALIGFIIIDLILAALVATERIGVKAAVVWSVLMAVAMALDPLTASYYKTEPQTFANYLFGITWFDFLLVFRVVTAAASWRAMRMP